MTDWRDCGDLQRLTIQTVDAMVLALPALGTFHLAGGDFSRAGQPTLRVLVRVRGSNDLSGWGEVTPCPTWCYETVESITTTIRHYLAPAVMGLPAWDFDQLHRVFDRVIQPGLSVGQPLAKSGIDTAVHDLVARTLGVPLYVLLGGRRVDRIELSYLISAANPEEAAAQARTGWDLGYRAFKVKVGMHGEAGDYAVVKSVRTALPEASFLWVDANQGYSLEVACRQAKRLADLGVAVFEQPLRGHKLSQFRRLVRLGALPIALDETLVSPSDLMECIRAEALDLAVAKVQRCAGLWFSRQFCQLAEAAGVGLLGSGLCETDLGLATSVHLFAAFGITAPCDLNGRQFVESVYLRQKAPVDGRWTRVPEGPGSGVEVDEELLPRLRAEGLP